MCPVLRFINVSIGILDTGVSFSITLSLRNMAVNRRNEIPASCLFTLIGPSTSSQFPYEMIKMNKQLDVWLFSKC